MSDLAARRAVLMTGCVRFLQVQGVKVRPETTMAAVMTRNAADSRSFEAPDLPLIFR